MPLTASGGSWSGGVPALDTTTFGAGSGSLRLADEQAEVAPAEIVADPVPEVAVGVAAASRPTPRPPQGDGDVTRQVGAGGAGDPQARDPRRVLAGGVLAPPAVAHHHDAVAASRPAPPPVRASPFQRSDVHHG